MVMRKAGMTEPSQVTLSDGLLVGRSSPAVCSICTRRTGMTSTGADPGCHPRLSSKSFDKVSPFGPSVGLASPVFALDFTVGPGMLSIGYACGFQACKSLPTIQQVGVDDVLAGGSGELRSSY
jgi:hypothetical protein